MRARTQQLGRLLASAGVLTCLLFAATSIGPASADAAASTARSYAGSAGHVPAAFLARTGGSLHVTLSSRGRTAQAQAPLGVLPAAAAALLAVGAVASAAANPRRLAHALRRSSPQRAPPASPH